MGDDDHRDAQGPVQLLQQRQDGGGGGGVQGGGSLVAQKHIRLGGQCPGDGHPLLLSAGKLGGIGVGLVLQPHCLQQLQGTLPGLAGGNALQLQGEAHVLQAGALHQQVEALEDHGDLPPGQPQRLCGEGSQLLAVYLHRAGGGGLQQVDAPDQGGLSGARQADDAEDLALFHLQAHAVQSVEGTAVYQKGFCDVVKLDNGGHTLPPFENKKTLMPCIKDE